MSNNINFKRLSVTQLVGFLVNIKFNINSDIYNEILIQLNKINDINLIWLIILISISVINDI